MPTAAASVTTAAGIHQPHGHTTDAQSNAAASAVNNATKPNRINAAPLSAADFSPQSVAPAQNIKSAVVHPSVLDPKATDEHALGGVNNLAGLEATLFQLIAEEPLSTGGDLAQLGQPHAVTGRVTKPGVDPVWHLTRRLGELHAASHQLLVADLAVVGGEEHRAGEALRDDLQHLFTGELI